MFKTLALAVAGALALAAPAPALAQSFGPTNSASVLSGTLYVNDGTIGIYCRVDIAVSINGSGAAQVTARAISYPNANCGLIVEPYGAWALAPGSFAGRVDLTIGIKTPFATCYSTLDELSFFSGTLTVPSSTLTNPSGPPCVVAGTLYANPLFYVL